MHPELVAISNVWQADVQVDTLKGEHDALTAAVAQLAQAHTDAVAARDAAKAGLEATKTRERHNNRELDSYVQRRNATRLMINDGSAPDYAAAERQLANCIALVDELETKGLDLLDALEARTAGLKASEEARDKADSAEKDAREALSARDASLRVELGAALRKREGVWAEMPVDHRNHYADLRRKKRIALVNVEEGSCVVCHMRVPPQKANEVQMKRAVHTCVGCGGYVLPG